MKPGWFHVWTDHSEDPYPYILRVYFNGTNIGRQFQCVTDCKAAMELIEWAAGFEFNSWPIQDDWLQGAGV